MKDRLQGVGRLAKAGVAILFMMVGAQAMAAPATAGSHIIQNQAFVDFKNLANVDQAQVGSNLVNNHGRHGERSATYCIPMPLLLLLVLISLIWLRTNRLI